MLHCRMDWCGQRLRATLHCGLVTQRGANWRRMRQFYWSPHAITKMKAELSVFLLKGSHVLIPKRFSSSNGLTRLYASVRCYCKSLLENKPKAHYSYLLLAAFQTTSNDKRKTLACTVTSTNNIFSCCLYAKITKFDIFTSKIFHVIYIKPC